MNFITLSSSILKNPLFDHKKMVHNGLKILPDSIRNDINNILYKLSKKYKDLELTSNDVSIISKINKVEIFLIKQYSNNAYIFFKFIPDSHKESLVQYVVNKNMDSFWHELNEIIWSVIFNKYLDGGIDMEFLQIYAHEIFIKNYGDIISECLPHKEAC